MTSPAPVLSASGIRKSYRIRGLAPVEVLRGAEISIAPGEKVAVLGRSGAGKSTLLYILGGLVAPDAGRVERPASIGFVFQSFHLMPELTVMENVLLPAMARRGGLAAARRRATELLECIGLAARAAHLPQELSGGECQRVALARALVTDPPLVLADEPTGNLDAATGADVLAMLAELSGSRTALVMVTHSLAAAAVCDRALALKDGVLAPVDVPAVGSGASAGSGAFGGSASA